MPPAYAVASLLLAGVLAGCVAAELPAEPAGAATPALAASLEPNAVEWSGHIVHSATDPFLHLSPTDAMLSPYEEAGFVLEVPEGATDLEVAVAWEGPGDFWIHTHSHEPAEDDPVAFRSDFGFGNPHCIRIPAESVLPGHWMVMVHSQEAVETDVTVTVLTLGEPATIGDDYHGHEDWTEPLMLVERDAEECTQWQAPK